MILTFGPGVSTPGIIVPCPELALAYWYTGTVPPIPPERVVASGLEAVVRTVDTEGGDVDLVVGFTEAMEQALQATIVLASVWDVVLLDSFSDSICPDVDQSEPVGPVHRFLLGCASTLRRLERNHKENDSYIVGRLLPNVVAPAGMSARCVFHNLYLAVDGNTAGAVLITPVVDGEELTAEAVTLIVPSDGVTRKIKRFKVPLTRTGTFARRGLVGTWFSFKAELLDAFGCGRMSGAGWELEFEPLTESLPGQAFTGAPYVEPAAESAVKWFIGGVTAFMRPGSQGTDDAGTAIPLHARSCEVAPAGVGGECLFQNIYLVLVRRNESPWTIRLTPIVDDVAQEVVEIELAGVTAEVSEVVEVSLSQVGGRVAHHPRGAWFSCVLDADEAPDKPVELHGFDLEYEVLTESLEGSTNG